MNATKPGGAAGRASRASRGGPGWLERWALDLATALMLATSRALRRLPPRVRYAPADAITAALARMWRRRRLVEEQFAVVAGLSAADPRVRDLARRSLRNFGRMAIDFLVSCTLSDAEVRRWVTPVGEPYLAEALAPRRGVIVAMPHLGSWDVGGAFASSYGFPVTVVIQGHFLARLVAGARRYQEGGVRLAPLDRPLRGLFEALKRNQGVVLLSDVAPEGMPTVRVPFFGRPAPFPTGPARLALRTGAPIMVVGCVRLADGSYRIEALAPLWADRALPEDQAVERLTAEVAAGFERFIARYPEHWYPYHRIWDGAGPKG
jgi:KDO2-lipid IV(A) lauroyltransferase